MYKTMKLAVILSSGLVLAATIAVLVVLKQEQVVFETYLIPSTMKEGWVTIEYNNANCPPLPRGSRRVFAISDSGYFCTSTERKPIAFYDWYYLVDENGTRKRLYYKQQVFHRQSIFLDAGNPNCKAVAEVFWYGKEEAMDNQATVALRKRHPECSGVFTPAK